MFFRAIFNGAGTAVVLATRFLDSGIKTGKQLVYLALPQFMHVSYPSLLLRDLNKHFKTELHLSHLYSKIGIHLVGMVIYTTPQENIF